MHSPPTPPSTRYLGWASNPTLNGRYKDTDAPVINSSNARVLLLRPHRLLVKKDFGSDPEAATCEMCKVKRRNVWLREQKLRPVGL